jgi:Domain of unknown function (DUF4252)
MRIFLIAIISLAFSLSPTSAQDGQLYWKYKDYGGINFSVPGIFMDIGSLFVKGKEERRLVRKVNKAKVMVFEDGSPITEKDMKRFEKRAKRRGLDDLVYVREGKTHVRIMGQERRNALRKLVVFVNTPDEFVLVSIKGRLKWKDVTRIIEKYQEKERKEDGKKILPPAAKIPVLRV